MFGQVLGAAHDEGSGADEHVRVALCTLAAGILERLPTPSAPVVLEAERIQGSPGEQTGLEMVGGVGVSFL